MHAHAWPAGEAQQDFASRRYAGDDRNDFAGIGRAQNVETRQDRPVLVGFPTHKREDLASCEADDPSAPVKNALAILGAKPQPVLDPSFVKDEHDLRHRYCHCDTPKIVSGDRQAVSERDCRGEQLQDHRRTLRGPSEENIRPLLRPPTKMPDGFALHLPPLLMSLNSHCRRIGRDGRAAPLVRMPKFSPPTTEELDSLELDSLELDSLRAPFRVAGQRVSCDPCA
jgi:hypothetical protein